MINFRKIAGFFSLFIPITIGSFICFLFTDKILPVDFVYNYGDWFLCNLSLKNNKLSFTVFKAGMLTIAMASVYAMLVKAKLSMKENLTYLVYILAVIITIVSENIITLLLFWEILSFLSFFIVRMSSSKASIRYINVHVISGAFILSAASCYTGQTCEVFSNHTQFYTMDGYVDFFLYTGVIINCALFPFFAWATDAYKRINFFALTILASLGTKTAIAVLGKITSTESFLITIGLISGNVAPLFGLATASPILMAIYAMLGQIGIIVAELGFTERLLLSSAHIAASGVYQTVIFIALDALKYETHLITKRVALVSLASGLASLSAVPGTLGFFGKLKAMEIFGTASNIHFMFSISASIGTFLLSMRILLIIIKQSNVSTLVRDKITLQDKILTPFLVIIAFISIFGWIIMPEYLGYNPLENVPLLMNQTFKYTVIYIGAALAFFLFRGISLQKGRERLVDFDIFYRELFGYLTTVIKVFFNFFSEKIINNNIIPKFKSLSSELYEAYLKKVENKISGVDFTISFSIILMILCVLGLILA